jgi:anti-anti-sigma factor
MTEQDRVVVMTAGDIRIVEIREKKIFEGESLEAFRHEVDRALTETSCRRVLFDFSQVELMTSAMLGLLVRFHCRIADRGGEMMLCCVSEPIRRALAGTQLDTLFSILPTRADALG